MNLSDLGVVERKTLGALLLLSDENGMVNANMRSIASTMGYKSVGGAITFALRILEMNNFIIKSEKSSYRLLV